MRDLKITTEDESIVYIFPKNGNKPQVYTTKLDLLKQPQNDITYETFPVIEMLRQFSPSEPTVKKKKKEWRCTICGIVYGENRDEEYDSLRLNCDVEDCDVWDHVKCLGLINMTDRRLKTIKWNCPVHRVQPPTVKKLKRKSNSK